MKRNLLIFVLAISSFMAFAQTTPVANVENTGGNFKWANTVTHDFGKIIKGQPVIATFEFINDGKEALIISGAKGSCGCTAVDYTKDPIAPGGKGFVKATYNAANIGIFNKTVTVTANIPDSKVVLYIKGEVVEKL